MIPKLVLTDIDGVWTDGGMYYSESGDELKKFSTSDSVGVLFLKMHNIPVVIITGEETAAVERRALKLKIDKIYQGVRNKLQVAKDIIAEMGIEFSEVAFIGDEINDIPLMIECGYVGIPANASEYMDAYADIRLKTAGGQGAFKEFVLHILNKNSLLEDTLQEYIKSHR